MDRFGVVANYTGDSKISTGAKCWILIPNTDHNYDRVKVLVKSRGGRWIETWVRGDKLHTYRAKWVPDKLRLKVPVSFSLKSDAQDLASRMEE